jgi:hypothetical protein
MQLNSKNLIALYYRWIYAKLPNDICSYFWGTVLILLISPIVIPGRIFQFIDYGEGLKDNIKNGLKVYLVYLGLLAVGAIVYQELKWARPDDIIELFILLPLSGLGAILSIAILGALVLLICVGVGWAIKKISEKREDYEESEIEGIPPDPSKISLWVGAIRKKHCTKITWK